MHHNEGYSQITQAGDHGKKAAQLFMQGYNCAQSVVVAYCDLTGFTPDYAARLSSSFGGGMGRMREVCGAVSGMLLIAGILYGYDTPGDDEAKRKHYALVQHLAGEFRIREQSIICREILKNPPSDPNPTPRTESFYASRPCARLVALAGEILDEYIRQHPIST